MGLSMSTLWSRLWDGNKEYRILILGLDNAGKTATLYKLRVSSVGCDPRASSLVSGVSFAFSVIVFPSFIILSIHFHHGSFTAIQAG